MGNSSTAVIYEREKEAELISRSMGVCYGYVMKRCFFPMRAMFHAVTSSHEVGLFEACVGGRKLPLLEVHFTLILYVGHAVDKKEKNEFRVASFFLRA